MLLLTVLQAPSIWLYFPVSLVCSVANLSSAPVGKDYGCFT